MENQSDPIELRQAITKFAYKNNANMVTAWHNQLFVGINEGVERLQRLLEKTNEKKEIIDIKSSIHIYKNYTTDNLRNFTLIMHLSNFEEISTHVCKEMEVSPGTSSSISRFKSGWEKKLEKKIGEVPAWTVLKDAEKIRHAILHSAGRISLNRHKATILEIIKKENLEQKHDRVYVTEVFLNKVHAAIWQILQ
jgi:hypothetical protein